MSATSASWPIWARSPVQASISPGFFPKLAQDDTKSYMWVMDVYTQIKSMKQHVYFFFPRNRLYYNIQAVVVECGETRIVQQQQ